jgi:hypothetical protein
MAQTAEAEFLEWIVLYDWKRNHIGKALKCFEQIGKQASFARRKPGSSSLLIVHVPSFLNNAIPVRTMAQIYGEQDLGALLKDPGALSNPHESLDNKTIAELCRDYPSIDRLVKEADGLAAELSTALTPLKNAFLELDLATPNASEKIEALLEARQTDLAWGHQLVETTMGLFTSELERYRAEHGEGRLAKK